MNLTSLVISAAVALAAIPACAVSVEPIGEPGPPPLVTPAADGTLTVRWLAAGSGSPAMCDLLGGREVEVVVYDPTGAPIARQTAPCASFSATLPLPEGTYSADVTLLGDGGRAVGATKTLQALEVIAGTDLAVSLDFPP